jgi:multidrug efflux pump subunit AcrB/ABC-type multidrug transport system ATPase subunit
MAFNPVALPVRRPTATSMFFLGLVLLGLFAWYRIPVELLPALSGEQLVVNFGRQGSEPEVVEREILLPLEARVGELAGLKETWGTVNGANGRLQLEFERGTNHRVRELELRSIAAELNRTQPEGTYINVASQDLTAFSRFAMIIQVTGADDANALRDFVDDRIQPRLSAVPGVSQVMATGGAPREVTVWIDPERSAAYGIRTEQLSALLSRSLQRMRYLGGVEQDGQRWQVILDGRPGGVASLGEIRVDPQRPVLLRHVADIEMGIALAETAFRINGEDATGLIVFQEEGANLVRLGRDLRVRLDALRAEFNPYGIDFQIGFDAAETVETQLSRLRSLAIWGFAIALIVLYLFLRELRAVAVVAVAVPVSLLTAGAMLYLAGYTLNLITLLGLVVGIGMLVDNSVVVFEAVQRRLEHGIDPESAAIGGVQSTVRAIITASATNAVVFLPAVILVEDSFISGALELIAVAILLPLFASLIVAIGLVPLLAKQLVAPAAVARLERRARRRSGAGGVAPDRPRALLSAFLKSALRRPAGWLVGVTISIVLTIIIALPWVLVGSLGQQAEQSDQVSLQVELSGGTSLDAAVAVFERMELAVLDLDGIERVESSIQEAGGTLTVLLDPEARDAGGATPARVREEARRAVAGLPVEVSTADAAGSGGGQADGGGGGSGGFLGETASDVLVSGPDMARLHSLAGEIRERLLSIPEVEDATISGQTGQPELRIEPLRSALTAYRLHPEQVLNLLNLFRREGLQLQVGFTLADGRELPLTVRRPDSEDNRALQSIQDLRLATELGAMPLGAVTTGRNVPAAPAIGHHNGRRELAISYSLSDSAPDTGPERLRLEEAIQAAVRDAYRPPGYSVEAIGAEEGTDWFKLLFVPILLLLYAVLAIAFESLTMPILVLIAVPLTILGATWALVLAGVGAGVYALVGVIALLGLTVNPAILLVDRMQRRMMSSGCSGGSAAMAAVRERTRPVLMTSCTTIAGLWPLALSTGAEFEIWPPFATVVIGGLATSTLLTLLVIPVGYVMLARIDRIFGRLGPWILMAWVAATAAVIAPLILTGQLVSLSWQVVTTLLVAAAFLWLALKIFRRVPKLTFDTSVPAIEARYLSKVYGRPGPVKKAWRIGRDFAHLADRRTREEARERLLAFALLLSAGIYLAVNLESLWGLFFAFLSAGFAARVVIELRNLLWPLDENASEQALRRRAKFNAFVLTASPWLMIATLMSAYSILPAIAGEPAQMPLAAYVVLAVGTLIVQLGRRSARLATADGSDDIGRMRALMRQVSSLVFGFDLPKEEVEALSTTSFSAKQGMIGILGPNGAGKSTLLRMLSGVLDPTGGSIHYSGRLKRTVGHFASRWIGYLPQEFGLPDHLTAEEYLQYFALLYQVGDKRERERRVDGLLKDVGLSERRNDRIGGFSGGMRQRVAVARTLLREPPIIIVDEPTVGLDPRERIRFRNLLTRLAEGRVVLFSTHVVEDVAVSCRRVIVMNAGRICYDGKPAELAAIAEGRTWEIRQTPGRPVELPAGCKLVDEVPDAGGGTRLRVLSASKPHEQAESVNPGIEDGYLQLMHPEVS